MSQVSDCEEAKPFLDEDQPVLSRHISDNDRRRNRALIVLPWILTTISWVVTIYLLLSRRSPDTQSIPPKENTTSLANVQSYRTYLPTDMEAMRSSISYEPRVFSGALHWNATSKRFIRNATADGVEYVGPPTPAIDDAWEALLHHEFTPMTEEEAMPYKPTIKTFNAFYRFEPDVMHSLHCVNEIRKRIDNEYYSQPGRGGIHIDQDDWDRIHIDHCIDQMRQSIMCFGDLSPVPLYSWEGAPLGIGQSSTHTCRKWEPIRQWVDQRHVDMEDPTYKPYVSGLQGT